MIQTHLPQRGESLPPTCSGVGETCAKRNGEPGWQSLGEGLQKLLTLVEGYRLARPLRRAGKTSARAIRDQS